MTTKLVYDAENNRVLQQRVGLGLGTLVQLIPAVGKTIQCFTCSGGEDLGCCVCGGKGHYQEGSEAHRADKLIADMERKLR